MLRKCLMMAALALGFSAGTALAGIENGPHDFSGDAWSDGEICKPCHTPHKAIALDISSRLWNHELTTATYVTRKNAAGSFNADGSATDTAINYLDNVSYLCMSCHDGTVALDAFGGETTAGLAAGAGGHFTTTGNLGTDRRMDHPVGLTTNYGTTGSYATRYKPVTQSGSGANTSYRVPVAGVNLSLYKISYPGGTVNATNSAGDPVSESDVKLAVGCRTCHNPHGDSSKLLQTVDNDASKLCLGCHVK